MFKSLALVSVLASAAFAQTSNSTTPAANPLIPTSISASCSTFLASLDSDSTLSTCLGTMSTATSAFSPGTNTTASSAAVTAALTNLCSTSVSNTCPDSLFRTKLTSFLTACTAELTTTPVQDVIRIYDVLYIMAPMKTATCSKADDDSWCAMQPVTTTREVSDEVAGDSSSLGVSDLLSLLYTDNSALKRRAAEPAITPNMSTYHDTNLAFLFLKPSLDASALCTTCARNILTAYINFESNMPYAPGLSASLILDTQNDLYSAISSKCPSGFLSGAVQAAAGLGTGSSFSSSGAVSAVSSEYKSILALAVGIITFTLTA